MGMRKRTPQQIVCTFKKKIKKVGNGCWEWTGKSNSIRYGEGRIPVRRFSLFLESGDMPDARWLVLTSCGSKTCINPEHLFLGTIQDQIKQQVERGQIGAQKKTTRDEYVKRFWAKVDKGVGCWYWKGAKSSYGTFWMNGENVGAHRFSMELYTGRSLGKEEWVLHHCDNPLCVNPKHLFLGDQQDNTDDMIRKNRHAKGNGHGKSKVNEDDVREIRRLASLGYNYYEIGRRFNLTGENVSFIVRKVTWGHVR